MKRPTAGVISSLVKSSPLWVLAGAMSKCLTLLCITRRSGGHGLVKSFRVLASGGKGWLLNLLSQGCCPFARRKLANCCLAYLSCRLGSRTCCAAGPNHCPGMIEKEQRAFLHHSNSGEWACYIWRQARVSNYISPPNSLVVLAKACTEASLRL